jgi:hypothetical protein
MQSTKPFLKEQFRKMSALRNAPTDEFACAAIREQWEGILAKVGEQRFAQGVANCVKYKSFFPSVDEFQGQIPENTDSRQRCPRCIGNEGFEYCDIVSGEGRVSRGVRKCQHT